MPCGCTAGGCAADTNCGCQRDGRKCTPACHSGDHSTCGNLDATAMFSRFIWSSWVGGVGCALFFVWLAISLSIGTGALCVPQSAVEYVASIVGLVVAIAGFVLTLSIMMQFFAWIGYGGSRLEATMLVVILGLGPSILRVAHESQCRIPAVKIAFERGVPLSSEEVACWIERDSVDEVVTLVTPASTNQGYHLLEGPHGCGKTELLKRACHKAGRGVLYVSVPAYASKFHEELAKTVNFNFNEDVSLWSLLGKATGRPNVPSDVVKGTSDTLDVIKQAAIEYKHEHGVSVVLVIDNTAELAREALPTFNVLHNWAKEHTDSGTATVVFSSSEGLVPRIIRRKLLCTPPFLVF